jgi:hypothetical protein
VIYWKQVVSAEDDPHGVALDIPFKLLHRKGLSMDCEWLPVGKPMNLLIQSRPSLGRREGDVYGCALRSSDTDSLPITSIIGEQYC